MLFLDATKLTALKDIWNIRTEFMESIFQDNGDISIVTSPVFILFTLFAPLLFTVYCTVRTLYTVMEMCIIVFDK